MANNGRKTRGRQKVAMVRMENDSNRLVTFSKRRSGLFKKASELCTLCGVDAAIIVFSPGRKAFSFGHPSVDATINRFIHADALINPTLYQGQTSEPQDSMNVLRSNMHLTVMGDHMELVKGRAEDLLNERKPRKEDFEWLNSIEECGLGDLRKLRESLNPLKDTVSHLHDAFLLEVQNGTIALPFMGPDSSESACQFPPEMVRDQNPMSSFYVGQPYQMAMAPTAMVPMAMVGSPSTYDHSQLMVEQAPIGGFADPSMTMGQNDMAMDHLNANTDALSYLPNPMDFTFPTQYLLSSFQEQNSSMEGQFEGLPPLPPMSMGFDPDPVDFQTFAASSSLSGMDGMGGPLAPYNYPNGFAFNGDGFN